MTFARSLTVKIMLEDLIVADSMEVRSFLQSF